MLYPQYFIDDLKTRADLVRQGFTARLSTKITALFILASLFHIVCNSQELREAKLIDSIPKTPCGSMLSRSDNFGVHLQRNPEAYGAVIWYGSGPENSRLADIYAPFFHRNLISRFGNDIRVKIYRSQERNEFQGDAWIIPNGVSFDPGDSTLVAEIPFRVTERTLFAQAGPGPCSNHYEFGFAEMLLTNPDLNGVIVDVSWRKHDMKEDAELILKKFEELKIPRNRLRIFFKRVKRDPFSELGYWELWLVPRKKR